MILCSCVAISRDFEWFRVNFVSLCDCYMLRVCFFLMLWGFRVLCDFVYFVVINWSIFRVISSDILCICVINFYLLYDLCDFVGISCSAWGIILLRFRRISSDYIVSDCGWFRTSSCFLLRCRANVCVLVCVFVWVYLDFTSCVILCNLVAISRDNEWFCLTLCDFV